MARYEDFYSRIPLKLFFLSFIISMVVDFIPFAANLYWLPELTILVLIYWIIQRPQHIGIGTAFVIGLLVDLGMVAPIGTHALSYSICAYLIISRQRQFDIQNYGFQALTILAVLMCNELILALMQFLLNQRIINWKLLLSPFIGALFWPIINKIMLMFLHSQWFRR